MYRFALALCLSLILVSATVPAYAHGSKHGANPCMKTDRHKIKHEMMVEGTNILLDTIMLLKEVAKDDATKKKAAQLEKRWRAHMESHEKMHQMMKSKHGKGHNACNPCAMGKHK